RMIKWSSKSSGPSKTGSSTGYAAPSVGTGFDSELLECGPSINVLPYTQQYPAPPNFAISQLRQLQFPSKFLLLDPCFHPYSPLPTAHSRRFIPASHFLKNPPQTSGNASPDSPVRPTAGSSPPRRAPQYAPL